jgi:hypothetical protein
MGWASYFEDNSERALDYALAAQAVEDRVGRTAAMLPVRPAPSTPPIVLRAPPKPTPVISAAERCRDIRDIHVLCLAELRPKATRWHHARL